MTRGEIFDAIRRERNRQEGRHPIWEESDGLAILTEEVGEVAKALNELRMARNQEQSAYWNINLEDELIQVAAVCVRWLENRG